MAKRQTVKHKQRKHMHIKKYRKEKRKQHQKKGRTSNAKLSPLSKLFYLAFLLRFKTKSLFAPVPKKRAKIEEKPRITKLPPKIKNFKKLPRMPTVMKPLPRMPTVRKQPEKKTGVFQSLFKKKPVTKKKFITKKETVPEKPVELKEVSEKKQIKPVIEEMPKKEFLETEIDKLLLLVQKNGKISTDDAALGLNVKKQLIEDWAQILSDQNLIELSYPRLGKIIMIKKEKEEI